MSSIVVCQSVHTSPFLTLSLGFLHVSTCDLPFYSFFIVQFYKHHIVSDIYGEILSAVSVAEAPAGNFSSLEIYATDCASFLLGVRRCMCWSLFQFSCTYCFSDTVDFVELLVDLVTLCFFRIED